jgi:RNA polymerase sigma-70 factor, ECF subfamily
MDEEWLAGRFEGNRARLRAMAYRMLGSPSDAEDAVQEAWIHVAGADADAVANLEGWFTTIVARVCLDMLRSRKSRREEPAGADVSSVAGAAAPATGAAAGADVSSGAGGPEQEAVLADSVGIALLVVLDRLAPAERVAFVLHDMFGVPFGEIAGITGRSADAARQLASRARRRVRGEDSVPPGDAGAAERAGRQRAVAEAFLGASRSGDLAGLLAVLDPDVVLRADEAAVRPGFTRELRGADAVGRGARSAAALSRRSFVALVDGVPGIVYAPGGRVVTVLAFRYTGDKISGIDVIADRAHLDALELALPSEGTSSGEAAVS